MDASFLFILLIAFAIAWLVDRSRTQARLRDLEAVPGYAQATQLLQALEGVREVAIEEVAGDTLRFRVSFAGDAETLKQTAAQSGRLAPDEEAPADGAVHFVLRP